MITILIPSIGKVSFEQISRCLASAAASSPTAVSRILVIDNASPGAFQEHLARLQGIDRRIEVMRTPERLTMAENWSFGLKQVETLWFLMLHDDDRMLRAPASLPTHDPKGTSFVLGQSKIWYRGYSIPVRLVQRPSEAGRLGVFYRVPKHCATVASTEIWKAGGGWSNDYGMFLDYVAFLQANRLGPCQGSAGLLEAEYVIHGANEVLMDRNLQYAQYAPRVMAALFDIYTGERERAWIAKHIVDFCFGRASFEHRLSRWGSRLLSRSLV